MREIQKNKWCQHALIIMMIILKYIYLGGLNFGCEVSFPKMKSEFLTPLFLSCAVCKMLTKGFGSLTMKTKNTLHNKMFTISFEVFPLSYLQAVK